MDLNALNADPQIQALARAAATTGKASFGGKRPEHQARRDAISALTQRIGPPPKGKNWKIDPASGQVSLVPDGSKGVKIATGLLLGAAVGVTAGAAAPFLGGGAAAGGASAATGAAGAVGGAAGAAGTTAATGIGGKVLGLLGGKAAALGSVGQLAGSIAGGRGAGRAQEAALGLNADQVALQRSGQEKDFEGTNARRMLSSDLLANMKATNIGRPSTWAPMNGATPGGSVSLSPEARQSFLDSAAQFRGSMKSPVVGVPGATPMPKSGLTDSILSILSGVGQFGGLMQPKAGTAAPTPGMANPQFRPPPGVRF